MKHFPVFELFEVHNFGLYPGRDGGPEGVTIEFFPGITLIVGANGLGKTTLITMLFRMITGPYDLPQLGPGDELGSRRIEPTAMRSYQQNLFASRVADRAETAVAALRFSLGDDSVTIERRLSDLALKSAQVGSRACDDEADYQLLVTKAAGLGSFGDLILMLRYLVFYFEDRRNLVWDPSAQRQLLRMLFLRPDAAQQWTKMERSILQNDSGMRNFQAVVNKEERRLSRGLAKKHDASALRAELQALEALQEDARIRLEEIEGIIEDLDRRRQIARLSQMRSKHERDARFRSLEYAKYVAIGARFPENRDSSRYILAHLMSEKECLVCGSSAPEAAKALDNRLRSNRCVVCSSELTNSDHVVDSREVADERVAVAEGVLEKADRELTAATTDRESTEQAFDDHIIEMTELRSAIAERSARLDEIIKRLPPSEATLREQRVELASLRGRLQEMKNELSDERADFGKFVELCTKELLRGSEEVVGCFSEFAQSFMSEEILLTWTSRARLVGQGGETIPFPVFELDMSGSDFLGTVRRSRPEDVSQSQREFIDLAFRMALMKSAGSGSVGLAIDTPESSLDAVFARRAGDTIANFGETGRSTVVVTSNLVEGNFLPTLISAIEATAEKGRRVVDLFDVARPTAAVEAERSNYEAARSNLFRTL